MPCRSTRATAPLPAASGCAAQSAGPTAYRLMSQCGQSSLKSDHTSGDSAGPNLEYLTRTPAAHSMRWAFPPPNRLSLFYRYSTFRASEGSSDFEALLFALAGLLRSLFCLLLFVAPVARSLSLVVNSWLPRFLEFRGPSLTRASFPSALLGPLPLVKPFPVLYRFPLASASVNS